MSILKQKTGNTDYAKSLKGAQLKITPQRLAVMDAVNNLKHPTAEQIIDFINKSYPNIATGTVYKILETFVEKGLIKKVKTEKDIVKYDSILSEHHHLYCSDTERIEDYYDNEINKLLKEYFTKKQIPNFEIEDIKLQIIGKFVKQK